MVLDKKEEYYSNCLLEAIKAKIKYGNSIKLIYVSPQHNDGFDFIPHWLWYDKVDGNVYDFHTNRYLKYFWNTFWWKGYIRIQPLKMFNRWYKSVGREFIP